MGQIEWNFPMPMGIPSLDTQHWELHRLLWRLMRALEIDPTGPLPKYRLIRLLEQTFEHFKTEEKYFQNLGYPDLVAHQIDHKRILEESRKNLIRWDSPGAPPLVDLVQEFGETIQGHLEKWDQAFATWLETVYCLGA